MIFDEGGYSRPYMGRYEGLLNWLETRYNETESENVRDEMLSYREEDICKSCHGLRLRPEALNVKINDFNIGDFVSMPIEKLAGLMKNLKLKDLPHNQ